MIQTNFPIVAEPYRELGEALGITEGEVIARIKAMVDDGLIRRLGGIFDSRKLGYSGALCAMRVPEDVIDKVAAVVNSFPGITHNYLRDHSFNMWFTVLAQSKENLDDILNQIRKRTGIQEIIHLPAENIFKIRVNFELD
jgi:DNA-binding Lrp family transcriptional regulator